MKGMSRYFVYYFRAYDIKRGTCLLWIIGLYWVEWNIYRNLVESGVRSSWDMKYVSLCKCLQRDYEKSHYILRKFHTVYTSLFFIWFIMLLNLSVSGFMETSETKKFVMFRAWWRVETDDNSMVNNIPETSPPMWFGVEISKFHIWSCVQNVKCLTKKS